MSDAPSPFPADHGPVQVAIGRFHVRRRFPPASIRPHDPSPRCDIFLVLAEGEWLEDAAPASEVRIADMPPAFVDQTGVLGHLLLWQRAERRNLADERVRLAARASLADQAEPPAGPGDTLWEEEDAPTINEQLAVERAWLASRQVRAELVNRALREVWAAHPEFDPDALLATYERLLEEDRAERRSRTEAWRRKQREWWNPAIDGQAVARSLLLGDVVAQYGRFRVHSATARAPHGKTYTQHEYEIRLAGSSPPLAVFGAGTPAAYTLDRAAVLDRVGVWLNALRQSIALGEQALGETHDPEVAARIRAGLAERADQYERFEQALREVESEDISAGG